MKSAVSCSYGKTVNYTFYFIGKTILNKRAMMALDRSPVALVFELQKDLVKLW